MAGLSYHIVSIAAVQLLWVNLIMESVGHSSYIITCSNGCFPFSSFAALALATDPADPSVLNRPPDRKSLPLITIDMWKMILVQAIYQIIMVLVLHFGGKAILGSGKSTNEINTIVFNAFVFCQVFNQFK
jgi:P-type Ca2+ transporter type 2C